MVLTKTLSIGLQSRFKNLECCHKLVAKRAKGWEFSRPASAPISVSPARQTLHSCSSLSCRCRSAYKVAAPEPHLALTQGLAEKSWRGADKIYKKTVLSQRWPRDARYINRSWAARRYGHSKLSKMAALTLFESKIAPLDRSAVPPKPHPITEHEVDRTTGSRDIATWNFFNMAVATILDLFEPEIAPLDPPSPKTLP